MRDQTVGEPRNGPFSDDGRCLAWLSNGGAGAITSVSTGAGIGRLHAFASLRADACYPIIIRQERGSTMTRLRVVLSGVAVALAALMLPGCGSVVVGGGGGGGLVDDFITVRAINSTDFDVDPAIEYGRSRNSLLFLDLGVLEPDEFAEVDIECGEALVLTTTDSTQIGGSVDYVIDPLPIFEIDEDYFCGELIEFEFVGNGQEFDVFVDAGGENIF